MTMMMEGFIPLYKEVNRDLFVIISKSFKVVTLDALHAFRKKEGLE